MCQNVYGIDQWPFNPDRSRQGQWDFCTSHEHDLGPARHEMAGGSDEQLLRPFRRGTMTMDATFDIADALGDYCLMR